MYRGHNATRRYHSPACKQKAYRNRRRYADIQA